MPRVFTAIALAPVAEDVADLEPRPDHGRGSVGDIEVIQRTLDLLQGTRCDLTVACGGGQLLVAEQDLDHPDILVMFQQVRRETLA